MSTGGVYRSRDGGETWAPSNPGIRAGFMPDDEYPEYGQCVHKVAARPGRGRALRAEPQRRLPLGRQRRELGVDRRRPAHRLRLHRPRPPAPAGCRVGRAGRRRRRAHPARTPSCRCSAPTTRARPGASRPTGLPDHSYTCVLRDAACRSTTADPVGVYLGTRNGDVFASADEGESFHPHRHPAARRPRRARRPAHLNHKGFRMPSAPVRVILPGMLRDLVGGVAEIEVESPTEAQTRGRAARPGLLRAPDPRRQGA